MTEEANRFPKVRVTGGPSPKDLKIEIDGKEVRKVFGAELLMGINQATAIRIHQYVEADIDVSARVVDEDYEVIVRLPMLSGDGAIKEWTERARGYGKTIPAALRDVADKLEPMS